MAFPATCTITGSYYDASGNPAQGTITFTPSAELTATTQGITLPPLNVIASLNAGAFSVNLVPTDTANVTPTGWGYQVTETIQLSITSTISSTYFIKPTGTGSINIATLAQYSTPPVLTAYGSLAANNTWTGSNTFGTVVISPALPITSGGTGQTAAAGAYNALSPMTTLGDIEYESAANVASRLAGNTTTVNKFLTQLGTGSASAAPGWNTIQASDVPANGNVAVFTSSNTWNKPANATTVTVIVIGAGGGGGSGAVEASGTVASGGAGGGGGGFTLKSFPASLLNSTETVTVGTAGTGGTAVGTGASVGNAGGAGGASSFKSTSWAVANGGGGGGGGTTAAATGGTGGVGSMNGGTGGGSSATGGAGSTGATSNQGGSGGGGAGGIATTPASVAGGAGGLVQSSNGQPGGTAGTSGGGAGGAGGSLGVSGAPVAGTGGGGGGSNSAGSGGAGGIGGNYGAGGGGGAGALTGNSSGAGGNGAGGLVVVITSS